MLKLLAERTQRQQAMAKLSAKAKQAQAAKAPAAAAAALAACGFPTNEVSTGVSAINPSRELSCSDCFCRVVATQEVDGIFSMVGNFSFEDQSWITFSAASLSWVHDIHTISYACSGVLADGVDGFLASNCTTVTTACTVTSTGAPAPQVISLAPAAPTAGNGTSRTQGPPPPPQVPRTPSTPSSACSGT